LLFSQQFGLNPHQLTNQFIDKSTLKQRIEMLNKPRSRKIALLKYGFTAPLFALMLVIASASIANNNGIKKVEKIVVLTAEMPITEITILPLKENILKDTNIVEPNKPTELSEIVVAGYKPNESYQSEEIFTTVEENPSFPDGIKNMYQYIARNLRYPEPARRAHVQGKVFVKFVVRKDGSVSDLHVLKGIGFGCDEETVRVLGSMPKWTPGKQSGKPVSVYFTMPVNFILEEDKIALNKGEFPWEKLIVIEKGEIKTFTDKEEIRKENERLKPLLQSGSIKEEISVNTIEKSMTIRILDKPKTSERGVNVFSQPNVDIVNGEPLFVIDGKVVAEDGISNLKPDEIATMEVLKNASRTAIYGEKGKNGVVVITTKKVAQAKEESNFVIKGKQLYTIKIGNKRQIIDAKTANDYSTDRIMQVNVVKVGDIKTRKTDLNEYEEKVLKEGFDGWVDIWVREQ